MDRRKDTTGPDGHGHDHSGHDSAAHADHDQDGHDHGGDDHAGHSHGPGGHDHTPEVTSDNESRLRLVFALTSGYAVVQVIGGIIAGSLALIADAGHMASDSIALLLALVAYRVARRPATPEVSYGFHRVRVLAALTNGAALLLLVAWITWEAVQRFNEPHPVLAGPMLAVAVVGLLVNIAGFVILQRGQQGDANLRGALLHVLGDLLGSVGAIAAAIGIMLTGWTVLDPILSVLVAVLVVRSAWSLVADSVLVLMQATPSHVEPQKVMADLASLPGIEKVAHLHVWTLTDTRSVATIHVLPEPGADPLSLPGLVAARLEDRHRISHVTVEVNSASEFPRTAGQH